MYKRCLFTIWIALLVAAVSVSAAHADLTVTSRVDNEVVTLDDTVQLTVGVSGSGVNGGQPQLPSLNGFRTVGQSTQQSFSLNNGSMQSSVEYVYELQPTRTGTLTVGPVRFKGQVTAPITVTVTHGNGGRAGQQHGGTLIPGGNPFGSEPTPSGNPKDAALVRQSVDHSTAYVGQQITYTFSFCQGDQLYGQVEYSPADTPGFVAEALPDPPQGQETINGRLYQVQKKLKALFATAPGKHTIGQASANVALDPYSGPQPLIAKPVTVNVIPLPTNGQPADFSGGVGSFHVSVSLDRQAVRAGETVTCTVAVRGTGNIRTLGEPHLALPDSVRLYKAGDAKRSISPGGGGGATDLMGGTATFSFLLLPKQAGTLTIPAIQYSYFDPDARAYRVATSQPVQLTVAPGSGAISEQSLPTNGLRPDKAALGAAIHTPLALHPWFWLLMALPLLLVGWTGWQRWQQVRLVADPAQARSGSALSLARRRVDGACKTLAGNPDACYAELNAALADYIADRTGAPPSGLTADMAYDLLLQGGAEETAATQARDLLIRTAAGRFAPSGGSAGTATELAEQCRQLMAELQRQVKPAHER